MLIKKKKKPLEMRIAFQNLTLSKIKNSNGLSAFVIDDAYSKPREFFPGLKITATEKTTASIKKVKKTRFTLLNKKPLHPSR